MWGGGGVGGGTSGDVGARILMMFYSFISIASNKRACMHALKHAGVPAVGVGHRNNARVKDVWEENFSVLPNFFFLHKVATT